MQIVVYSKQLKEKDIPVVQEFFDILYEEEVTTYVHAPYLEEIKKHIKLQQSLGKFEGYLDFKTRPIDFMITLGGDGTILNAITEIRDSSVPILGINLGRLGFLADIEKTRIRHAIHALKKGMYRLDTRQLLHLESNIPIHGDTPFALNDCTLLKQSTSSMITVHAYVNGAYLNSYWADGIIIATPTGSTGYSLSCGGPIIFPGSGNFIITPVAPHNLNVRPIVLPDTSVISFEIEGRADQFLCTLDSRLESVTSEHELAVRKCDFSINLIQLQNQSFLKTIRGKLAWGVDNRN